MHGHVPCRLIIKLMSIHIPYKYICVEGNIGVGKTSFTKMIKKDFDCELILEEFQDNPFLPFFYEDMERYAFSVELFFMTERYKQLQGQLLNQGLFQQFIIADYAMVKSLLFAKNNLIEEEFRLFQKLWNVLSSSFPKPDILVYFHRDVNILMDFIKIRGRDYEKLIKSEYLLEIQNTYFEYFRNILSFPVLIIDLNTINFVENANHYQTLVHILSKTYLPGVHRVRMVV